jgi:hypothetical protein
MGCSGTDIIGNEKFEQFQNTFGGDKKMPDLLMVKESARSKRKRQKEHTYTIRLTVF